MGTLGVYSDGPNGAWNNGQNDPNDSREASDPARLDDIVEEFKLK